MKAMFEQMFVVKGAGYVDCYCVEIKMIFIPLKLVNCEYSIRESDRVWMKLLKFYENVRQFFFQYLG